MPSKYDAVLPGLKPAPVADLTYQAKVDEAKKHLKYACSCGVENSIDGVDNEHDPHCNVHTGQLAPTTLAILYGTLCDEDVRVKKLQYDLNVRFAALEQLLADSQERGEPGWGDYGATETMLKLQDGTKLQVLPEPYGQVKDKEAFRQWCIANGYERQMHLWPSTMNSICKERLVEGEALPEGCEVFRRPRVVYTPVKK